MGLPRFLEEEAQFLFDLLGGHIGSFDKMMAGENIFKIRNMVYDVALIENFKGTWGNGNGVGFDYFSSLPRDSDGRNYKLRWWACVEAIKLCNNFSTYKKRIENKSNKKQSGIYYLIRNQRIVYIGQSVDMDARIKTHKQEGVKVFDKVIKRPCAIDELDEREARAILKCKPEYNKAFPSNRQFYRVKNPVMYNGNWYAEVKAEHAQKIAAC